MQSRLSSDKYTDASTVISMLPIPLCEVKPGLHPGQYVIPAVRDPMNDFTALVVIRGSFPVYIDENRPALIVPEPSDRIAESICRDYKVAVSHYQPGVAEPGLLWVKEAWSKEDIVSGASAAILREIENARIMQTEWFKRIVSQADDDWAKQKSRRIIADIQRHAAVALGLRDKEWNIDTIVQKAMDVCKFCRTPVDRQAMVCPHCNGVLDMERYNKEFVSAKTLQTMGLMPPTPATPPSS